MPTAAVVFETFASVIQVHVDLGGVDVCQVHGWQVHHGLICQALGIDAFWYEGPAEQKNHLARSRPLELIFKGFDLDRFNFNYL